ncbi:MAG: biotin transporter BioY [Oscillospiraceae bacterium]|nr:biotin transporter BioY [Oscillospiraceae bacterium]
MTARDLAAAAMGAALLAVCSWLSIPTAVPFTMQTFAVCFLAGLLGLRRGLWTVVCWLLLAAAGAPVLAGFKGGLAAMLGPTGGYLIGFLFTALTVGLGVRRFGRSLPALPLCMALGVLLCYAFGTAWFLLVYAKNSGPISLGTALGLCVLPYLFPDAVKIALAGMLVRRLYPILEKRGVSP